MKKGFFFSVFSIGLICLSSIGAIERTYNNNVNDVTYQESSNDGSNNVNSSSTEKQTSKDLTVETNTTVTLTSVTVSWTIATTEEETIRNIELIDDSGSTLAEGSTETSGSYTITGLTTDTTYSGWYLSIWWQTSTQSGTGDFPIDDFTTLEPIPLTIIEFTTSDITSTSATLNWNLDMGDAQSIDKIEISDTANGIPSTNTGSVLISDSYTLTGLTPNTSYDVTLTVTYVDFSGDLRLKTSTTSFTTSDPTPLSVIDFTTSDITKTSATLNWNLDMGDAQVIDKIKLSYTDPVNGLQTIDTGSVLPTDSYTLTGLTPSALYDVTLTVTWTDYFGIEQTTTDTISFTTLDPESLSIIEFTASNVTETSATLSWNLNMGEAQSIDKIELNYTDPVNGLQTIDTGSILASDSYTLTGLTPGTLYDVTLIVSWTDYFGNPQTTTDVESFTTSDPIPLSVIDFNASNVTNNSAKLNWNLDMGDAQSIDKIELSYTDPVNGLQTIDTGLVSPQGSYEINGLTPGTLYNVTLIVSWTDFFGDPQTTTDVVSFTTANKIELSVTDFGDSDLTETSATLSWNLDMGEAQSIDKIELSYTDPVNGLQTIDTGSVLATDSYTLTGLTPGTLYDVTLIVSWTDYFGNPQTTTDVESFTTSDPIPLSVIDFAASDITNNTATLNWNLDMGEAQSIDDIQLTYIDPIDGNQLVDTGSVLPSDSYTLTGLKADSTYDVTLIVTWTNFIGDQQTTTEVTSFTTSNAVGLSVIDFSATNITNNSATLSWNLEMADAQSIDKIELSYTDPVNGLQTIDTGSVLASDSYTLTDLKADSTYDLTLIVSWTDYLGVQQTTNSDVVSFTTSYEELEIVSTNIQADESTNQAIVSWEIEANDSTIENIVITNSNNEVLAEGSTDAIGSYTIDSSNEENYDWNIIVAYSSPSGTQTTSNETITNVVVNADSELPIFEIVGGVIGIIFVIAIICLIYFISKHRKSINSLKTDETQIDAESYNDESQIIQHGS